MKLKQLVITGFKSFADKTILEFHEGVTGIVGPNGCGKSNVVDAVRWVLGETSAKALRGGEMADVIFNGTDKRKALGMAEVILTFSDCEKSLGVDYNEVSIGRRVYRDGKGEYELNGQACRMKDIARLFMDTGVGRNMYSIMEQGKIDILLSAQPEDRRQVFEEAAGITKSKAEKKEALRKLEYTEANLLRVTDILSEMKRQMGSAQRQASKARRYQELFKDVVVMDTHLHFRKYSEFSAERAELETSVTSLRLRQADLEQELEKEEREMAEGRAELSEMEAMIGSLRNQLNQIQGQINAATHRIAFNGERTRELEGLIEESEVEIATSQERLLLQQEELERTAADLLQMEEHLVEKRAETEEYQRRAAAVRDERAQTERRIQEARQGVHAAEGIIIAAQAEITSHTSQNETDRQRQEQLQRDLNLLEEERRAKQKEHEELRAQIEEAAAEIEYQQLELHQREREFQEVETELELAQRRLREQHRAFSEKSSKLQVLRQLIHAGEGLESGTRHVLGGLDDAGQFASGIHGLLSTYLEVEPAFIPAVEAALGSHLQAVLVRDASLAAEIISLLTSGRQGTAVVLPNDLLRHGSATQMQTLPESATAWALDKVKAKEPVAPAVNQLLGNVCVVPDLETGLRLKRELPDVAFATLHGEFISAEGCIRGGAGKEAAGGILHRQAELATLEGEVTHLEAEVHALEAQRETLTEQLRTLKNSVAEQRELLQARRVGESTLQGQSSLVQREIAQFASKLEGIEWEQGELLKRQNALAKKVEDAVARRGWAEQQLDARQAEAANLADLLEEKRRAEAEAVDRLNDLKTALAVDQRTRQALQEQRQPMENRLRELEQALAKRRRDIENYREKITAAEEESDALTRGMNEGHLQVEELTQVLESRAAERAERAAQLQGRENTLGQIRRQTGKLTEQRGQEEVRMTQIGLRMENLAASAMERYRTSLETFEPDAHALLTAINSQKALRTRPDRRRSSLTAQEDEETPAEDLDSPTPDTAEDQAIVAAALGEDGPDWGFVETVVAELKQRIDSMGPVNLDAIQEFEELEQRFNFLQKEYDDLNNAKGELLEIIQRINIESKQRFLETFHKVRTNFRTTFKELFGQGAVADLQLLDENEPLECGIEITAKPPGKKPQTIKLLSGGERSMTAVALLFSIYMVKPSPFCILDELDAPLDESNIGRFLRMLDKFIGNSQFVIVTHNKRTMRRADVLYGVTMEEFGVSRPIGMKMSDSEKHEMREREAREIEEQDRIAAEAEAKLAEEDPAEPPQAEPAPPVRTTTTESWIQAMQEDG